MASHHHKKKVFHVTFFVTCERDLLPSLFLYSRRTIPKATSSSSSSRNTRMTLTTGNKCVRGASKKQRLSLSLSLENVEGNLSPLLVLFFKLLSFPSSFHVKKGARERKRPI